MISLPQIERLVEQEAFGRLVHRVLANGRCADAEVIDRLKQPGELRPAALGLALQRVCELSYASSRTGLRLANLLMRLQAPDGRFGPLSQSAAATAIALRGLLEFAALLEEDPDTSEIRHAIDSAIERGIGALAARQRRGAVGQDTIDAAIALWQLGGCGRFQQAVCLSTLMREVAAGFAEGDRAAELCRFAYAAAA